MFTYYVNRLHLAVDRLKGIQISPLLTFQIVPFRCGQETRVIPRILQLRSHWLKSEKESVRLQEAGISKEVMNSAIAQFCLEIIAKHGEPAPRLCNKDPLTLKMGSYVIELFPNVSILNFTNLNIF